MRHKPYPITYKKYYNNWTHTHAHIHTGPVEYLYKNIDKDNEFCNYISKRPLSCIKVCTCSATQLLFSSDKLSLPNKSRCKFITHSRNIIYKLLNNFWRCSLYNGQTKKKCSQSSITSEQKQKGSSITCMLNRCAFKSLHCNLNWQWIILSFLDKL